MSIIHAPVISVVEKKQHLYLRWAFKILEPIISFICLMVMVWKVKEYGELEGIVLLIITCGCVWLSFVNAEIHGDHTAARAWLVAAFVVMAIGVLNLFMFIGSPQSTWIDLTQQKVSPFMANPHKDVIVSLPKAQSLSHVFTVQTKDGVDFSCLFKLDGFGIDTRPDQWKQQALDLANSGETSESIVEKLGNRYSGVIQDTIYFMTAAELLNQQSSDIFSGRIESRGARIIERLGLSADKGAVSVNCTPTK